MILRNLQPFIALLLLPLALPCMAKPQGEYPPAMVELTIPSHGSRMPALAYLAAGLGPHPTVLLLHGYPGNEKNLDLAQGLRQKGWNVVFFHYRGAWGSEGEFSFLGAERDVQEALRFIAAPENAARLRLDTAAISTVGHSMGGHMALAGILDNPGVRCAVSLDGANLGTRGLFSDPDQSETWKAYGDSLFMLRGWSGDKALLEVEKHAADLDLINRAGQINARPVLFIAADTEIIPIDSQIKPLVKALQATPGSQISYQLIDDDHSFSASRAKLIDSTARFLHANCRS